MATGNGSDCAASNCLRNRRATSRSSGCSAKRAASASTLLRITNSSVVVSRGYLAVGRFLQIALNIVEVDIRALEQLLQLAVDGHVGGGLERGRHRDVE